MIRDKTARRISCEWHGGGGSALYALCSTGAIPGTDVPGGVIVTDAEAEIGDCQRTTTTLRDWGPLQRLREYVRKKGPRGPVDGWGKVPW